MENETQELNQMREQIYLLRSKLDKQEIVNDRLIKEATKRRLKTIHSQAIISNVAALFVITFGSYNFYIMGMPWRFIIGTIVYMLICLGFTLYYHYNMNPNEEVGLVEMAQRAALLKKRYQDWLKFAIPSVIAWVGWLIAEYYFMAQDIKLVIAMSIGIIVGGIIGGIWGFSMHKKVVRNCEEIIRSAEELKKN